MAERLINYDPYLTGLEDFPPPPPCPNNTCAAHNTHPNIIPFPSKSSSGTTDQSQVESLVTPLNPEKSINDPILSPQLASPTYSEIDSPSSQGDNVSHNSKSKHITEYNNQRWRNPQNVEDHRQKMLDMWSDESFSAYMSKLGKQRWEDPSFRQRSTAYWDNPEHREAARQRAHDPELKRRRVEGMIGHAVSQTTREQLSRIHIQKCKENGTNVVDHVYPLAIRGFTNVEMVDMLPLKRKQIAGAVKRLRKQDKLPERTDNESQKKREAYFYNQRKQKGFDNEYLLSKNIVQAFQDQELLSEDLTPLYALKNLYANYQRQLPSTGAERTRLEFFLQATRQYQEGDTELMDLYEQIGREVDEKGFTSRPIEDELFIWTSIYKDNHSSIETSTTSEPIELVKGQELILEAVTNADKPNPADLAPTLAALVREGETALIKDDEEEFLTPQQIRTNKQFLSDLVDEGLLQRLIRRTYIYTHSREASEDMTQETFLKMLSVITKKEFSSKKHMEASIYKTAKNKCIDRGRRKKSTRRVHQRLRIYEETRSIDNPESVITNQNTREEVSEVLSQMSPQYQEVLLLKEVEGLSCRQIGEWLGKTESAVKSIAHRARGQFQDEYELQQQLAEIDIS